MNRVSALIVFSQRALGATLIVTLRIIVSVIKECANLNNDIHDRSIVGE